MPFIRLKVKNGVKEDFNVAHVIRFSPNEDKTATVTLTDSSEVTVEDSAQAVRSAIRRAESPVATIDAEPAAAPQTGL